MANVVESGNLVPIGPGLTLGVPGQTWDMPVDGSRFTGHLSALTTLSAILAAIDALVVSAGGGISRHDALGLIVAEIAKFTGQAADDDASLMLLAKMPEVLQRYGKAYAAGGPRQYEGTDVRIYGIKDSPYTLAQYRAIPDGDWGAVATRSDGVYIAPAYIAVGISKTDRDVAPGSLPAPYEIRRAPDLPVESDLVLTRLPGADTPAYYAYSGTYPTQPAGDQDVILEIIEPATSNILPPDGTITRAKVRGLQDAPVGDVITAAAAEQFGHHTPSARRELYNGTMGIAVANATSRSGLAPVAFDTALNRDTAGDVGLVFVSSRRRLVTRSSPPASPMRRTESKRTGMPAVLSTSRLWRPILSMMG